MIHKARYLHPGSLFSEETTETLDSRDPEEARQKAPTSAFAFVIYDIEAPPDLGPDFTVIPKPKNESSKYYLGGTIHTLAEVEVMGNDFRILASNMRGNCWDHVVHTCQGNWQPLEKGDVIVRPVTEVIEAEVEEVDPFDVYDHLDRVDQGPED